MNKQPERSVEEIVEEFKENLKMNSRGIFYKENPDGSLIIRREGLDWLTQTLTAERQRCKEMVEDERKRIKNEIASFDPRWYSLERKAKENPTKFLHWQDGYLSCRKHALTACKPPTPFTNVKD